ncbi:MAG: ribonuclease III [Acidimicrobiales bacterium]
MGYRFADPGLLTHALTHRSFCAENENAESNERLEFLGDAVVGLAVTDNIFAAYPDLAEGQLAKLRASVVNTAALAQVAQRLDLGALLRLGKGEDQSGGREKESILADVFEAVIGAVFVDGSWDLAADVVLSLLQPDILVGALRPGRQDYKTRLQELTALLSLPSPTYDVVGSGPDHDRRFEAEVSIGDICRGRGIGTSKKRAEQAAAEAACAYLADREHGADEPTSAATAVDAEQEDTHGTA